MSELSTNSVYSLRNAYFTNMYMTDGARVTVQPDSDDGPNQWFFIWNSGGGPNLGGNWTIRNAQTCNHLYPSKTSFIWDIWNTSDGFLFSCPQTYQSLGLRTGSPSSTVMFLEPANVTDPKQLLWLLNPTPVLSTNCSNDTNS